MLTDGLENLGTERRVTLAYAPSLYSTPPCMGAHGNEHRPQVSLCCVSRFENGPCCQITGAEKEEEEEKAATGYFPCVVPEQEKQQLYTTAKKAPL